MALKNSDEPMEWNKYFTGLHGWQNVFELGGFK